MGACSRRAETLKNFRQRRLCGLSALTKDAHAVRLRSKRALMQPADWRTALMRLCQACPYQPCAGLGRNGNLNGIAQITFNPSKRMAAQPLVRLLNTNPD